MLPFPLMLLGFASLGFANDERPYPVDGSDLHSFVSRPDIRAPRFNVTVLVPQKVTPGYWFTAPYGDLRSRLPTTLYQPGQVGPHIYDGDGQLLWSGAHLFDDRPTFDFKVAEYNGADHLTFITHEDLREGDSPGGSAIILDSSYRRVKEIEDVAGRGTMNMHEYNTIDHGKRALTITFESRFAEYTAASGETEKLYIGNNGFSELDIATGEAVFSWWALDHIDPSESLVEKPNGPGSYSSPWDAYHINSVDKKTDGDYLISARYTNAIYKVSGVDGHIIWRLGGSKSSFVLEDFDMSSQHDARYQSDNETTVVITLFNNRSDGRQKTGDTSSAMEVALDLKTMTARVLQQWDRPDGGLTKLRGNAQRLRNGNIFTCWSENSLISEHTADGELVMAAQMASHRLVTYRAYKMNFTGSPLEEEIAVKAFVFGVDEASSTIVAYASWNGATEVKSWRLYGVNGSGDKTLLGEAGRVGFETMLMAAGSHLHVVVEALDAAGNVLGASKVVAAELPRSMIQGQASQTNVEETLSGELDDNSSQDLKEQMSVSEALSVHLHHAAGMTGDISASRSSMELTTSHLALFVVAAALLMATLLTIAIRRSRKSRTNRPDLGVYQVLSDTDAT